MLWQKLVPAVVLILLTACSSYPRLGGPADMRWDASTYFVLGKSLAEGKGYRLLNEPGEIREVQYPPAVPALIAGHMVALHSTDVLSVGHVLKLTWCLLFAGLVVASYFLFARFLSRKWAFALAASLISSFPLILIANTCTADLCFAVLVACFFVIGTGERSPKRDVLAGLFAAAAFFTRTLGIALLIGWIVEAAVQRRFRIAVWRAAALLVCVGGWSSYIANVQRHDALSRPAYAYQRADYLFYNVTYAANVSYRDPYRPELGKLSRVQMLGRTLRNSRVLPRSIGEVLTDYSEMWQFIAKKRLTSPAPLKILPGLVDTALWILGAIVLVGIFMLLRRNTLVGLTGLIFIAGVCASPWPQQYLRYLLPISAVLILAAAEIVISIYASTRAFRVRRFLIAAMVVAGTIVVGERLLALYLSDTSLLQPAWFLKPSGQRVEFRQEAYHLEAISVDEACDWIATHSSPDQIIASVMPQWAYLRTGRRAVMPPFGADLKDADQLLASVPVRYFIRESRDYFIYPYTKRMIEQHPSNWKLVFVSRAADTKVYERIR